MYINGMDAFDGKRTKNVSNYNKNQIWPQNFALVLSMQETLEGVVHSFNWTT